METFEDFVDHALCRFEFELSEPDVIREKLQCLHDAHSRDFPIFEIMIGMQGLLQVILELLVFLDRMVYLTERGLDPKIVRLFNPLISPRCYAIYCVK